jgi:hypothetical protein
MLAVIVIVVALGLAFPVRQGADDAMTSMNCSSPLINDSVKAGCYIVDLNPFYFIGTLIAIGGVVLGAKIIFGG